MNTIIDYVIVFFIIICYSLSHLNFTLPWLHFAGKSDIEQFLTTHPEFKNYDWKTVHIKVMNEVYKKKG